MKKYSMYTFAVAMLAGMILTGCSSSEEIPGGTPDNGPKLKIETRSADAAEAAYAHRAILVSEGNIADAKSAADAAALGSRSSRAATPFTPSLPATRRISLFRVSPLRMPLPMHVSK